MTKMTQVRASATRTDRRLTLERQQYIELERLSRLVDEEVVRARFTAAKEQPIRVLRHGYVC